MMEYFDAEIMNLVNMRCTIKKIFFVAFIGCAVSHLQNKTNKKALVDKMYWNQHKTQPTSSGSIIISAFNIDLFVLWCENKQQQKQKTAMTTTTTAKQIWKWIARMVVNVISVHGLLKTERIVEWW